MSRIATNADYLFGQGYWLETCPFEC